MEQQFVRFVRAVEGRLVSRWDVGPAQYFGARLGTPEERAAGKAVIWDTEMVIPLTASFVASFPRELAKAIRHGDLKSATPEEYSAWLKVEQAREDEADKGRESAAKAAAKDAAEDAAKASSAPTTDEPNTKPTPDGKAEKRK